MPYLSPTRKYQVKLHEALAQGDFEAATSCLKHAGVHLYTQEVWTTLHESFGVEAVTWMVNQGISFSATDRHEYGWGRAALNHALKGDQVHLANALVQHGVPLLTQELAHAVAAHPTDINLNWLRAHGITLAQAQAEDPQLDLIGAFACALALQNSAKQNRDHMVFLPGTETARIARLAQEGVCIVPPYFAGEDPGYWPSPDKGPEADGGTMSQLLKVYDEAASAAFFEIFQACFKAGAQMDQRTRFNFEDFDTLEEAIQAGSHGAYWRAANRQQALDAYPSARSNSRARPRG